jgi:plastocyanin
MNKSGMWITIIVIIVLIIIAVMAMSPKTNTENALNIDVNATTTVDNSPETSTSTESTVAVAPKTVTVEYTDAGFAPATVTINKGDTVKFVNNSSGKMWVASAPHPTHTDYPEFDEDVAVSNGESYSFTFDKVGSWKYHNHVNSSKFGTVVVQ